MVAAAAEEELEGGAVGEAASAPPAGVVVGVEGAELEVLDATYLAGSR